MMKTSLLLISLGALIQQQESKTHGGRRLGNIYGFPDGMQRRGRGRWCLKWCPEGEESDEHEDNARGSIPMGYPYEGYPRISGGYEDLDLEEQGLTPNGYPYENSYINPLMASTGMLGRLRPQAYGLTGRPGGLQTLMGLEDFDEDDDDDEGDWEEENFYGNNELGGMIPYGGTGENLGGLYGTTPYGIAAGGMAGGLFSNTPYGGNAEHQLFETSPYGTSAWGAANRLGENVPNAQGITSEEEPIDPFSPPTYGNGDGGLFEPDPYGIASAGWQDNFDEPHSGEKEHETLFSTPAKRKRSFRMSLADKLGYDKDGAHKRRPDRSYPFTSNREGNEHTLKAKPRTHRDGHEDTLLEGGSDLNGRKMKLIHRLPRKTIKSSDHGDHIHPTLGTHDHEKRHAAANPHVQDVSAELASEEYERDNDDEERPEPEHPPKKYEKEFEQEKVRESRAQKRASDATKPGPSGAKHVSEEPGLAESAHKGRPNKGSPKKTGNSQPALLEPPNNEPPSLLGEVADLMAVVLGPMRPPRGINTTVQAGDHASPIPHKPEKEYPRHGKRQARGHPKPDHKAIQQKAPHQERKKTESKNIDRIPDLVDNALDLVNLLAG